MEQSRLFIAIALSFVIFLVWQMFFIDKEAIQKESQPVTRTEEAREPKTPAVSEERPHVRAEAPPGATPAPVEKGRVITVDAPLYSIRINEQGAAFDSFVLKNYRETVARDSPYKELIPEAMQPGSILVSFEGQAVPGTERAIFKADVAEERIVVNQEKAIVLRYTSPRGVIIEKRYSFHPERYWIDMSISVKNGSDQAIRENLVLSLFQKINDKNAQYGFQGPSGLINGALQQVALKEISEKNLLAGEIKWIAMEDQYFISSIIPVTPAQASMRILQRSGQLLENQLLLPISAIQPGTGQSYDFGLFLGPKSMSILDRAGYDLGKVINFGWFDIIAKPCLWLMNLFYRVIPNYGIAIIILTLFSKIILWPLGTKSYRSMNEMKKLQPLMTGIREKYKNDKKRMNEEIMGLYRVYKINPMSGCLPVIVQFPVFIALYRMLYQAIELRHAPFFGWINDLSAPDRLFNFGFSIPFMEPPYGIPVLTIIMGGTMFLQQKMSPAPGDPGQAKVMMLMPVIFTFIFINFSSGLVLYWLVSNVLSIAQQYYISKKIA